MRAVWIFGPIVLLRIKTSPRQNAIEQPGRNFGCNDGFHGRSAEEKFPPRMMGGEIDRISCDLGLEDRRNRLRFSRQTAFDPAELWSIQRGQLHHGDLDIAP